MVTYEYHNFMNVQGRRSGPVDKDGIFKSLKKIYIVEITY